MLVRRAAIAAAVLAAVAFAAPAAAATVTKRVAATRAVERTCQTRLLPAGTPGVARARFSSAATGVLTVRLAGAAGDWDLAVFDARGGPARGAGATYGRREVATVPTARRTQLVAQACRRTGGGRRARVSFDLHPVAAPAGPREPAALVRVDLGGAGLPAVERLEQMGLDVTHDVDAAHATVVVYSAAERARLLAAGFAFDTLVPDLRAADLQRARIDARYKRAVARSALPSGRDGYRTLADYGSDLKSIVDGFPAIARRVEIGRSLEDRPIEGVELARSVAREDDGRPVFLVMGLHHAREWPSGEMPMELALDLARRYGSDKRVRKLLDRVRVIVIPVVNPDGFEVSRTAGATPFDDDPNETLPLAVSDGASYKRKNCRAAAGSESIPCMSRPAAMGVDLNRNYGAYWGGAGSSSSPSADTYRGSGPFSEPEAEAVRRLSSTRPVVTVVTHHTFTRNGEWLRQPGFCFTQPCNDDDVVPDERGMRALGDAMATATGWDSDLSWAIGEITGATEDWNYYTQGAYGYTPEQRAPNFHSSFQSAVVREYTGTAPGASGGVREALLRAGEEAADPKFHSILRGAQPPGRILRLTKSFDTRTSVPGLSVADRLDFRLTVPGSGAWGWHVNQSTRPLAPAPESYTLTCERPGGGVIGTRQVVVRRGQDLTVKGLECGGCADVTRPTSSTNRGSAAISRRRVRLTGHASDRGCAGGGGLDAIPGSVLRVRVAVARRERGGCRFLTKSGRLGSRRACSRRAYQVARGTKRWSLKQSARLPAGSYLVWTRAEDASGNAQRVRTPLARAVR